MSRLVRRWWALAAIAILSCISLCGAAEEDGPKFIVTFSEKASGESLDGRVLVAVAKGTHREPRFSVNSFFNSEQVFGVDVEGMGPGAKAVVGPGAQGYPVNSTADIPPGIYNVQAVLHTYETFHRADGHVVKLPMDNWEGQQWNRSPGNLYSAPVRVEITGEPGQEIEIVMDRAIEPIEPLQETKYVKYQRMRSDLLSEFWGRDMEMGAIVLLPEGWEEHPEARYPLVINHGHYPSGPSGFRETPPDEDATSDARVYQEAGYDFYKLWTGENFPRVVSLWIQHASPYYDDSYAVNSANNGPYGDAILHELIPLIEEKYRCIGEPWARVMHGGSTGGWISLAVQVFYPDDYNGCWAYCPDSASFKWFQAVDIYEFANAYHRQGQWTSVPVPLARTTEGNILATMEGFSLYEAALGNRCRSGGQIDIFFALYGPVGDDGYPKPLWDKLTGEIDPEVAAYWRENYDLVHILERDWKTLGPRLEGKIHVYMGDMDTFYLNNAAYLLEEFLESTTDPYYGGEIKFRARMPHCWTGNETGTMSDGYRNLFERVLLQMVDRMLKTAPKGADTKSWLY